MAKDGWNLWELDRHHGELWENRFQQTLKNPTVLKIAKTPSGWAVFRDGIKPMWEDEQNCGRLTAKKFQGYEIHKILESFFGQLANDKHVSGIVYTRKTNISIWLKTVYKDADKKVKEELKKKFAVICSREEKEIVWDNFKKSKKINLNMTDIVWKYGELSAENDTVTDLSVYDIDILEASPNFVLIYKREFPIQCVECFLVETTFPSPFDTVSIKQFVEACFYWFQNSKSHQIIGISKAIALKIVNNYITIRFYNDPIGYCRRSDSKYKNFHEVLILFAQKWKTQLIQKFLDPKIDMKISGFRAKDRDLQFTI